MISDDFVFTRIGMALVSAQRVEFVTGQVLQILSEDGHQIYRITTKEFFEASQKAKKARKMLGEIFRLLKLNPKLVIEHDLDNYLKRRNILVHHYWRDYLNTKSEEQKKRAVNFCNEFGKMSVDLEKFFKGFLYFLALRHVENSDFLTPEMKRLEDEFVFFSQALQRKNLDSTMKA